MKKCNCEKEEQKVMMWGVDENGKQVVICICGGEL